MTRFDRQMMIDDWNQAVLRGARVLVVGAGTTGNEIIKNLVLLGVGNLVIVDRDVVEEVNLSRSVLFRDRDLGLPKAETAATMARELAGSGGGADANPTEIRGIQCDIVHDYGNLEYRNFDCVFLTVDNLEARMWVNRYCWLNRTTLIDTGLSGTSGNVFVVVPPETPCLECTWSARAYQRLADRYSCLKIGIQNEEKKIPMVITSAAVIAGMAVQAFVKLMHGAQVGGVYSSYLGDTMSIMSWQEEKRGDCAGHAGRVLDDHAETFFADVDEAVSRVSGRIADQFGSSAVEIWSDKEIVYATVCNGCGEISEITPVPLGKFARTVCAACGALGIVPKEISAELKSTFTFSELGIPRNHALRGLCERRGEPEEVVVIVR